MKKVAYLALSGTTCLALARGLQIIRRALRFTTGAVLGQIVGLRTSVARSAQVVTSQKNQGKLTLITQAAQRDAACPEDGGIDLVLNRSCAQQQEHPCC